MSKDNGFEGLDIENMFAEAVGASENTGESNPEFIGKNAKANVVKEPEKQVQEVPVFKKDIIQKPLEVKQPIIKEVEKPVEKPVERPAEKLGPLIKSEEKVNLDSVNVNVISRVIEMKEILDSYSEKEKGFIKEYFQKGNGSLPEIIYAALTANQRGLDALNKIVIAKGHNSAERAFYLMELSNSNIEAIYEQIDLLAVQLDDIGRVSDLNKIAICRKLESVIADMEDNVFIHINKLQEFTNRALD